MLIYFGTSLGASCLAGMQTRWAALASLLAAMLGPAAAAAQSFDDFRGTRTETLFEREHTVAMTLYADHAELVVRRSLYNAGFESDQAVFDIELPDGGVATRLRSRGTEGALPWFEGELMEREAAAAKYRELTGLGTAIPKDPALLYWVGSGRLGLQVFPCPPQREKVVEYTVVVPTRYAKGAYRVELPRLGTPEKPAHVRLSSGEPGARLTVNGRPFESRALLPNPGAERLDLALIRPLPALSVELSTVPIASGRVLTRFAVKAGPKLSTLPRRASVVIAIDASRSLPEDFEPAAKSAIDAYLSHLPDARVQLLTFDRRVRQVLDGFRTVEAARAALVSLTLARKNGSDLDRALFHADQLLAGTPDHARRVLVLTDGLSRSSLTGERLRGALAQSGALAHVGLLQEGEPQLELADGHSWSDAARSTGGLVWQAHAPALRPTDAEQRRDLVRVYEEWARPLRIHRLGAYSDNSALADRVQMAELWEGEGSEELYLEAANAHTLNVAGELWASPVRATTSADSSRAELWAALTFGNPVHDELSDAEQMTLATRGHAVSPVTSFLAIEPGVRPSVDGLEPGHGYGWSGRSVRSGQSSVAGTAPHLDLQKFLERQLASDVRRCGAKPGQVAISLETTRDEIVQVSADDFENNDPQVEVCLSESVWALLLPTAFHEEWAAFSLSL